MSRTDPTQIPLPPGPIVTLVYRVKPEQRERLLAFLRDAFPFYERGGGVRMGLWESADEPGLLFELVAYGNAADFAAGEAEVAHDPATQAKLKEWRSLFDGGLEVRRYQPIPGLPPG